MLKHAVTISSFDHVAYLSCGIWVSSGNSEQPEQDPDVPIVECVEGVLSGTSANVP